MNDAPYITLDPCYVEQGSDEHDNWCERGMSKAACVRCGKNSTRPRAGWWVGHPADDLFYCDPCVTTHYPEEV